MSSLFATVPYVPGDDDADDVRRDQIVDQADHVRREQIVDQADHVRREQIVDQADHVRREQIVDQADHVRREHIVAAAEACFARWGVQRTRMEDIAKEAKLPRPALYRSFESKADLQTAVMVRHIRRRAAELHAAVPRRGRAGPLILRALLAGTVEPPGDHVSESVLGFDVVHDTARLVAESPAIFDAMKEYWEPYLAYAAKRGELREGVDVDDAVRWLTMIVFDLLALPEVAPPRERLPDYFQTFVVDALVSPAG